MTRLDVLQTNNLPLSLLIDHQFFQNPKRPVMKRRHFIMIGTAGIAAVSIPTAYYFLNDIDYDRSLADPQSLSLIWDTETIKKIGNQYRLQMPSEKSERSLVKTLKAAVSEVSLADAPNLEEIIKKDFETGNIIIVDGWILSRTEARQCALFSLTEPK